MYHKAASSIGIRCILNMKYALKLIMPVVQVRDTPLNDRLYTVCWLFTTRSNFL